jgi:hypothetical protein
VYPILLCLYCTLFACRLCSICLYDIFIYILVSFYVVAFPYNFTNCLDQSPLDVNNTSASEEKFPLFMEYENSLTCSQEPATSLGLELQVPSPNPRTSFYKIRCIAFSHRRPNDLF